MLSSIEDHGLLIKKVRKSVKNLIEKEEATGKSEGSLDKLELRSVWNL
jgi:hypothetical protein